MRLGLSPHAHDALVQAVTRAFDEAVSGRASVHGEPAAWNRDRLPGPSGWSRTARLEAVDRAPEGGYASPRRSRGATRA